MSLMVQKSIAQHRHLADYYRRQSDPRKDITKSKEEEFYLSTGVSYRAYATALHRENVAMCRWHELCAEHSVITFDRDSAQIVAAYRTGMPVHCRLHGGVVSFVSMTPELLSSGVLDFMRTAHVDAKHGFAIGWSADTHARPQFRCQDAVLATFVAAAQAHLPDESTTRSEWTELLLQLESASGDLSLARLDILLDWLRFVVFPLEDDGAKGVWHQLSLCHTPEVASGVAEQARDPFTEQEVECFALALEMRDAGDLATATYFAVISAASALKTTAWSERYRKEIDVGGLIRRMISAGGEV